MLDMAEQDKEWSAAQYPDAIRFRMPRGLRELVKQAAQAESVPASEFIRRAIGERVERLSANQAGHALDPETVQYRRWALVVETRNEEEPHGH